MRESTTTYEISYWLKPAKSEGATDAALRSLAEKVAELGGKIITETQPAKRRLAYPIQKEREGYFGTLYAELAPEAAEKFTQSFAREKALLRLMIAKFPVVPSRSPRRSSRGLSPEGRRPRAHERALETPQTAVISPAAEGPISDEKPTGKALGDFDKRLEEILKT